MGAHQMHDQALTERAFRRVDYRRAGAFLLSQPHAAFQYPPFLLWRVAYVRFQATSQAPIDCSGEARNRKYGPVRYWHLALHRHFLRT